MHDLTNTFFEGSGKYNDQAFLAVQRRSGATPVGYTGSGALTAAGFRAAAGFAGNASEPATLETMVTSLAGARPAH
ncbi:MAG: hypothetical protein IPP22_10455 [Nitrosomonas sp.]|nr:hypothetical protein [Nitrosomonas sp.]